MKAKYDSIGIDYNLTRKADPYLVERFVHHLQPTIHGTNLDIGCGTGNYTSEFQKKGLQWIGMDPSPIMLEKAIQKNNAIDWQIGTAENTGLPDHSIHRIIASLTIHHWADLQKAFSELYRVLLPEGQMVIFTSTPKQMKGYWLHHYFPNMLADSMLQMPSLERITQAMETANFKIRTEEPYMIQADLQDHFLYCGKHNPELYFNPQIRNGISSFSSLGHKNEVAQGLLQLRKDIDSGAIDRIIKSYENDLGDYVFIVGEKQGS
ncbi:MAG: SAM-dependent methyltransferase [Dokdonia sp.]|jgi:SAM-dependent methyltransferase